MNEEDESVQEWIEEVNVCMCVCLKVDQTEAFIRECNII